MRMRGLSSLFTPSMVRSLLTSSGPISRLLDTSNFTVVFRDWHCYATPYQFTFQNTEQKPLLLSDPSFSLKMSKKKASDR